jgi:hypothetical protein
MPGANSVPIPSHLRQTQKYFPRTNRLPLTPFLSPCSGRGEGEGAIVKGLNAFALVGRYPDPAPGAAAKPKLLDRLCDALRCRYSFARHLLDCSYDIWTIQELLGHNDVGTNMICTDVLNKEARACV